MQGFFHGTGHGLGLQIHEPPSISPRPPTLRAGHVVTVEPGLYYLGLGGVRIEDVALVTADGLAQPHPRARRCWRSRHADRRARRRAQRRRVARGVSGGSRTARSAATCECPP